MNKKKNIQIFISILLLTYIFSQQKWGEVIKSFECFSIWVFFVGLSIDWIFLTIDSFRLHLLSNKAYPVSLLLKSRLTTLLLANFMPGQLSGELLRVFLIDQFRPGRKLFLTLILLVNKVYGLLSVIFLFAVIYLFDSSFIVISKSVIIIMILSFFIPLILNFKISQRAVLFILKNMSRFVRKFLLRFYLAIKKFSAPSIWLKVSLLCILSTLLAVFQTWILSESLNLNIPFSEWVLYTTFIFTLTFLPVSFGSFGTQDAGFFILAGYLGLRNEPFIAISITLHFFRIASALPSLLWIGEVNSVFLKIKRSE